MRKWGQISNFQNHFWAIWQSCRDGGDFVGQIPNCHISARVLLNSCWRDRAVSFFHDRAGMIPLSRRDDSAVGVDVPRAQGADMP